MAGCIYMRAVDNVKLVRTDLASATWVRKALLSHLPYALPAGSPTSRKHIAAHASFIT